RARPTRQAHAQTESSIPSPYTVGLRRSIRLLPQHLQSFQIPHHRPPRTIYSRRRSPSNSTSQALSPMPLEIPAQVLSRLVASAGLLQAPASPLFRRLRVWRRLSASTAQALSASASSPARTTPSPRSETALSRTTSRRASLPNCRRRHVRHT